MRRLGIIAALAAVALLAVPALTAWAAEQGPPPDRPRGPRPGEGGRAPPPPIELTAEQQETLGPLLKEALAALGKLHKAAVDTLGAEKGNSYVMQAVFGFMREHRPPRPEGDRPAGGEGTRRRGGEGAEGPR